MRAKLRKDLVALAGFHDDDCLSWEGNILASVAGRSLEVENVTVHTITLRLSRTVWRGRASGEGWAGFGTTLLSVPHEWLETDITKDEFTASRKNREEHP